MRALENQDHCLELDDEINYYFCKKKKRPRLGSNQQPLD